MKIRLALFIFSTFCTFYVSAQWTWRNPLPQGNDLNVIRINSDNSVWAAGGTGTIMQSTDGGINWQIQNLTRHTKNVWFKGLDFPEDSVAFAVESMGYIFKTLDGGATWDSIYWEEDEYLYASCFTDTQNGFVACSGGKILRTNDGGTTWDPWYFSEPVFFTSIAFPSPQVGYVVGDGHILKSLDGGKNWNEVYFDSTADLQSLAFPSPTLGFAVGDTGLVLKTTDGGNSWTIQHLCDTVSFTSIGIFSPDTLILNGFEYSVTYYYSESVNYRSTDGGNTWVRLQLPPDSWHTLCIHAQSGGIAYISGKYGCLTKTMDYGDTWVSLFENKTPPVQWESGFYGIDFPTIQTGYAVADRTIIKTTNGGETWNDLDTVFQYENMQAVDFANDNIGCIGGNFLYSTLDGGVTWVKRTSGPGGIHAIAFAGTTVCVAVGHNGLFLRSTDYGQSWTAVTGVPEADYRTVCFADQITGYVAGDKGWDSYIMKTTDAGVTWNVISTGYYLADLDFPNSETGFGVGGDGHIIRTTDGGMSWEQVGPPVEENLYAVDFYDADTGYVVGGVEYVHAIVLKTTDGGTTWYEQFIPTNYPLYSIAVTGNSAFTGGLFYNLFGTTNGGISVSSELWTTPQEIFTSVYPNPSSSGITIETPYPGQLSILSLSGQILLTRQVTESRTVVEIRSLPSGIYVVKVVGNEGTQVGKFVKE